MPEKVGVRVMPLVIVATLGPETVFHSRLAMVPSESLAVAPVGAEVLVGKVIALSGPALTVGGTLGAAETTTCISSGADTAPLLSVAVRRKTYVPTVVMPEKVGVRGVPFVMVTALGPENKVHELPVM